MEVDVNARIPRVGALSSEAVLAFMTMCAPVPFPVVLIVGRIRTSNKTLDCDIDEVRESIASVDGLVTEHWRMRLHRVHKHLERFWAGSAKRYTYQLNILFFLM